MKADITISPREMVDLLRSALTAKTGTVVGNIFVADSSAGDQQVTQLMSITCYQQFVNGPKQTNLLAPVAIVKNWSES